MCTHKPHLNEFQQPIGGTLPDWSFSQPPAPILLPGKFCSLEPLDAERHGFDLFSAMSAAADARDWTYLANGPFTTLQQLLDYLRAMQDSSEQLCFCIVDKKTQRTVGYLCLMRIQPRFGVIEVGNVYYSPWLKRTSAATEAQYLLMNYVFEALKYRRLEWKCDSLNAASRHAALRLGFSLEGIFRQATIYKGRSRDTVWFSVIDKEWPLLKGALERWLDDSNFDKTGTQRKSLTDMRLCMLKNQCR